MDLTRTEGSGHRNTATTPLDKAIQGEVTLAHHQIRELIEIEAREIGLSFDDAVRLGQEGKLPTNHFGRDIAALVRLLA